MSKLLDITYKMLSRLLTKIDVQTNILWKLGQIRLLSSNKDNYLKSKEDKYKSLDGIPEDWDMIYRCPNLMYIKAIHSISLVSSMGLLSMGAKGFTGTNLSEHLLTVDNITTQMNQLSALEVYIFLGALIVANIAAQKVIHEYVFRIYQKDDNYKVVFIGLLPWKTRVVDAKAGAFSEYNSFSIIPWGSHRFKMNNKVVIMLDDYFKTASHMFAMFKEE